MGTGKKFGDFCKKCRNAEFPREIPVDKGGHPWYTSKDKSPSGSPRTCLAAFGAGYFFAERRSVMMLNNRNNMMMASQGAASGNSIDTVVSVFQFHICVSVS